MTDKANNPPLPERDALVEEIQELIREYGEALVTRGNFPQRDKIHAAIDRLASLADDRAARHGVPVAEVRTMMTGGNAGLATHIVALSGGLQAGDKLYAAQPEPIAAEPVPAAVLKQAYDVLSKALDGNIRTANCNHWAGLTDGRRSYAMARDARIALERAEALLAATPAPEEPADRAALAVGDPVEPKDIGCCGGDQDCEALEHCGRGQLDPRTATEQARTMLGYCQSFNGQPWGGIDESVDRKNLAVALDNLEETASMLLNMAARAALAAAPEAPGTQDGEARFDGVDEPDSLAYRAFRADFRDRWNEPDAEPRAAWSTCTLAEVRRWERIATACSLHPVAPEAPAQPEGK